ncbi:MAG: trypsin-like serine protease [Burkholderiaceae bacterium]|nr:MAG: trypsin-like serine protease [Burkholderiaceae bacterium]
MRKLWLIFSQAVTVGLAGLFVVGTFRPEWLQARKPQATISVSQGARTHTPAGSLAPAAGRAAASVVSITTSKADKHKADPWAQLLGEEGEDDEPSGMGMGSGVVASAEGHILTNHHVVAGADDIEVMLPDGRQLRAQVVGTDPDTDLAILKIQADKLTPITFGNSDDLQIGDAVLALGNPFGVGQTVTAGIISALNRTQLGLSTFENFIQTDAAINPGNSGGALVDTEGRLLGINSAIYSRSGGSMGIGFAIPVSTARQVMEQIIKDGRVVRGWIGVELRPLNPALAKEVQVSCCDGVLVAGVLGGGPADQGGMKVKDVIVKVAGQPIRNSGQLLNSVAALTPGTEQRIEVLRGNQAVELTVKVGNRPPIQARKAR